MIAEYSLRCSACGFHCLTRYEDEARRLQRHHEARNAAISDRRRDHSIRITAFAFRVSVQQGLPV